ncbi:WhiB family transcriptional regulator [Streptomyces sp. NPDC015171]|uniref:WhiB family transcriptional regulator n=1 Tax=Streptomyces sp. NPDC015171 TaxID=3364945 RepID=UPI0036F75D13
MSGSRTGTPNTPAVVADDRIPFPHTDGPTRCQADPKLFAIEDVTDHTEREKALAQAKAACSGCPIVKDCLKWPWPTSRSP